MTITTKRIQEHPIITEWNAKTEQEQYTELFNSLKCSAKCYNMQRAFSICEKDELINEAWLNLMKRLNNDYIENMVNKGNDVNLKHIIMLSASATLNKVIYDNKQQQAFFTSNSKHLNDTGTDVDIIDMIIDTHQDVEKQVINKITVNEMLQLLTVEENTVSFVDSMTYSIIFLSFLGLTIWANNIIDEVQMQYKNILVNINKELIKQNGTRTSNNRHIATDKSLCKNSRI